MRKYLLYLFFTLWIQIAAAITHFEPADISDKEFLIEFSVRSNDIYQTRIVGDEVARAVFDISDSVFEDEMIEILKVDEEIVGFFTLKLTDDHLELGHLFVKGGLQGNGYGTLLFRRAVDQAKSRGWNRIEWLCDPDAAGFYDKMGAKIIGTCENLLNPVVDLPIFEYVIEN